MPNMTHRAGAWRLAGSGMLPALTAVLVNKVFFRTPWQEISSVLLRRRWS